MSSIQLSDALLGDIQAVLEKHDPANKDSGIGVQYLAAILGYIVANFPTPSAQKTDIMNQLFQFASHVMAENDVSKATESTANEAYGVWKPNK